MEYNSKDYLRNDKELQEIYLNQLIVEYLKERNIEIFLSGVKSLYELYKIE